MKKDSLKSSMVGAAVTLAAMGAMAGGEAALVPTKLADLRQVSLSKLGSTNDSVLSRSLDRVVNEPHLSPSMFDS
ncbi:hypothetical protein AB0L00_29285 [Actinoallomurus sp. NPDC052308]|uniref:hypothetical protein n=1 Tax=Actinoallomurus sp. NPDC052308 TaxID=3155530 RepID=UPI003420BC6A